MDDLSFLNIYVHFVFWVGGFELLSANGGRFEINQLLFADNTALVADSEEKLCRFLNEFDRVSKEES